MREAASLKRREFPWRCAECGQKEVYAETIEHVASVNHDGRLHEIKVPQLDAAKCRHCGAVVFDDMVGEQVADALRQQLNLLTPQQIRAAIQSLGFTQKRLAAELGIAEETLSRWCTGALIQSRSMDRLLRGYFSSPELRDIYVRLDSDPALGSQIITSPQ